MFSFIKKWFCRNKVAANTRKSPRRNDGLSAEKNVIESIRYRTGCTPDEARNVMRSTEWKVLRRPGDYQKFYDQRTREAIIKYCVNKLQGK